EIPAANAVAESHAAEGDVEHIRAPRRDEWGRREKPADGGVSRTPTDATRILLLSAVSNRKDKKPRRRIIRRDDEACYSHVRVGSAPQVRHADCLQRAGTVQPPARHSGLHR